jgi:hypothetical protein
MARALGFVVAAVATASIHASRPDVEAATLSSNSAATASCVSYSGQLVGRAFTPRLALPPKFGGASLGGNFYGAGGRSSTLEVCLVADGEAQGERYRRFRGLT